MPDFFGGSSYFQSATHVAVNGALGPRGSRRRQLHEVHGLFSQRSCITGRLA
jgi:hypothetical protein